MNQQIQVKHDVLQYCGNSGFHANFLLKTVHISCCIHRVRRRRRRRRRIWNLKNLESAALIFNPRYLTRISHSVSDCRSTTIVENLLSSAFGQFQISMHIVKQHKALLTVGRRVSKQRAMELPARKNGGISVEMENMGYISDSLSPNAIRITQYDINHLTIHQVRMFPFSFQIYTNYTSTQQVN